MYTNRIKLEFSPEYAVNVSVVLHTDEDSKVYLDVTVSRNLLIGSAQLHELRREYDLTVAASFINNSLHMIGVTLLKVEATKIISQIRGVHRVLYGELTSGN